jgi:hypothetical protein
MKTLRRLTPLFSLLLATSTTSHPTATPNDADRLLRRDVDVVDLPSMKSVCHQRPYDVAALKAAAQAAFDHKDNKIGDRKYPKDFANQEGLGGWNPNCNLKNLQEFPLQHDGVYAGADPPPADRVMVEFLTDRVRYCGTVSHWGATGKKNAFRGCEPMYTYGKGSFE